MRIVLVAEEAAGTRVMRALHQREDDIVAVMAKPDSPDVLGASVWSIARALGYETWPAEEVRQPALAQRLRDLEVDVVLNVHSLYVVHADSLTAPQFGWFNLHPGPLPEYAGLNVVSWAICQGEETYGVTVHRMAAAVDTGAIVYQERFDIGEEETALTLSATCVRIGASLMIDLVRALARDPQSVPSVEQDPAAFRTYRRDERPDDSVFSWAQPAKSVTAFIRAFDYYPLSSPWGHPQTMLAGRAVGVIGATSTHRRTEAAPGMIEPSENGAVLVACADEWVRIRRLHLDGRTVDASSILADDDPSVEERP